MEDAVVKTLLDACDLKPATRRVYESAIRRSRLITGLPLTSVWMRPRSSYAALDLALRGRSVYTLLTTVASITAIMGHVKFASSSPAFDARPIEDRKRVQRQWTRLHDELSKEVDALRSSGRPYGRQAGLVLSWSDVVAKDAELRGTHGRGSAESLLSAFYVHLEPRRQSDYHRVRLVRGVEVEEEEEPAVLDVGTGELVVRRFKRSDAKGPWKKTLPSSILADVRRSLAERPREYLFCFPDGRPFNVDNFTKYHNKHLKQWFGENASNNMLRHARATAVHGDPSLSLGDRRRIAADMGHSLEMNMSYSVVGPPKPKVVIDREELLLATLDGKTVYACRRRRAVDVKKEVLTCFERI